MKESDLLIAYFPPHIFASWVQVGGIDVWGHLMTTWSSDTLCTWLCHDSLSMCPFRFNNLSNWTPRSGWAWLAERERGPKKPWDGWSSLALLTSAGAPLPDLTLLGFLQVQHCRHEAGEASHLPAVLHPRPLLRQSPPLHSHHRLRHHFVDMVGSLSSPYMTLVSFAEFPQWSCLSSMLLLM